MSSGILDVAMRLGAKLKRTSPTNWEGPCPVCGGRDRFSVNPKKDVFNCRGCGKGGDAIALVRHVLGVNYREARAFVAGERESQIRKISEAAARPPPPPEEDDDRDRGGEAAVRWALAVEPRGTPAETYLRSRGLTLDGDAERVIRWSAKLGAMLALFRSIENDEERAISRTFLDGEGRKLGRKFLGPVKGCAIKLDADEEVTTGLVIGEGLETCMAARQLGLKPCWALGAAGAIATFPVLDGIEALTILREHDEANAKAAAACASRWRAAGREVFDAWPRNGKDINDTIIGDPA